MFTHSECEISQSWRAQFSSHEAFNLNRADMPLLPLLRAITRNFFLNFIRCVNIKTTVNVHQCLLMSWTGIFLYICSHVFNYILDLLWCAIEITAPPNVLAGSFGMLNGTHARVWRHYQQVRHSPRWMYRTCHLS